MTDINEIKLRMAKKLQETTDLRAELSLRSEIDVNRLVALDESIQDIINALKTVNETIKESATAYMPPTDRIPYRNDQYRKTKGTKPMVLRIDEESAKRVHGLKELYKISYADVVAMLLDVCDDMYAGKVKTI